MSEIITRAIKKFETCLQERCGSEQHFLPSSFHLPGLRWKKASCLNLFCCTRLPAGTGAELLYTQSGWNTNTQAKGAELPAPLIVFCARNFLSLWLFQANLLKSQAPCLNFVSILKEPLLVAMWSQLMARLQGPCCCLLRDFGDSLACPASVSLHPGVIITASPEILTPVPACGWGTCGNLGGKSLLWCGLCCKKWIFSCTDKANSCPCTYSPVCAVTTGPVAPHAGVCVQRCFVTIQHLSSLQANWLFQQE